MSGLAVFSEDGTYRYKLVRWVAQETHEFRTVLFVGLNPSTADGQKDDPTVRRMIGYAQEWGYDRLVVCNIFAFRSTDPRALALAEDPVGPQNDTHLIMEATDADLVVACWGVHGDVKPPGAEVSRGTLVRHGLRLLVPGKLHVLGLTNDGHPCHPLYLRKDLAPVPWV